MIKSHTQRCLEALLQCQRVSHHGSWLFTSRLLPLTSKIYPVRRFSRSVPRENIDGTYVCYGWIFRLVKLYDTVYTTKSLHQSSRSSGPHCPLKTTHFKPLTLRLPAKTARIQHQAQPPSSMPATARTFRTSKKNGKQRLARQADNDAPRNGGNGGPSSY